MAKTKFIQICASQDDLFALDVDGDVYQYNFTTKTWVKLTPSRSNEETLSEQARSDRRNRP
ncbi:MAG: hypothetical protein ACREK6_01500 [Candidatus Rokuibacteriota bacterium]